VRSAHPTDSGRGHLDPRLLEEVGDLGVLFFEVGLITDIGAVLHPKRIHAQNNILNKLNLF
jgi:hypothetical protein